MISSSPAQDNDDGTGYVGGDAIDLLEADHRSVTDLFAEYDALAAEDASDDERMAVALAICQALTAHATAEEELLYPAARQALGLDDFIDEAEAEHAGAKELIAQIQAMDPSDQGYDATVRALQEAVNAHVLEEESELFPRLRESDLDLTDLGDLIAQRMEDVNATLDADEA